MWDSNVYLFSLTTAAGGLATAYSFNIGNLPDTTIWGDFEMYRIDRVDIVVKPFNLAGYAGAATLNFGLWAAYDPDDGAGTTITSVASKATARVHSFNESWEESIVPLPSPAVYNSSPAFSGYSVPDRPIWIDSVNTTVPHFGFKLAAPQSNAATTIQLFFRYHVSLKMNQ
jgi:hypothetical protein